MSFLTKFKAASQHIKLRGNLVFVEEIPSGELTKEIEGPGGSRTKLILAASPQRQLGSYSEDRPLFVRVLDVGPGYFSSETNSDLPLDTRAGMVCLLPAMSVRWLSDWGDILSTSEQKVGYTRDEEILAWFESDEAMQAYKDKLKNG